MPVTYELDTDASLICTRCVGDVVFDEVVRHFAELAADPRLPARTNVLLDLSASQSFPEAGQVEEVVDEIERLRTKVAWGACAVVATSDIVFGMSRVFQTFAEEYFEAVRVFRELDAAERWLAPVRSPSL